MLTRRRFLAISAALVPAMALAGTDAHVETGLALGASVTLRLHHPDAPRLAALAMAEIRRLEAIFSLYQTGSSLSRLNAEGHLPAPPPELLECLTLAGAVHGASGGLFDPTVQPLWRAEAMAVARGKPLDDDERQAVARLVDWAGVNMDPQAISLRPGMELTLNGIAQGFVADKVAALLAHHGLTHALIDTGELAALPDASWPVGLPSGKTLPLQGRAVATSAPLGMTFGGDGRTSHILNPQTARPVNLVWSSVSVSAPLAALADAISTAACLTSGKAEAAALCDRIAGAALEAAILV